MTEFEHVIADPPAAVMRQKPGGASDIDRWMGVLAHELRTPLNAVVLALEALEPAPMLADQGWVPQDVARMAAQQMQRIITDVLDLCRHRAGHLPSAMETMNLSEVVVAAVHVARPLMMEKGHLLVVSMPTERIMMYGHRGRIEQALTNLLTNAANYTNNGGRIALTVEPAAGSVVVRVRDNGIGINASLLPHVFDCYRRGATLAAGGGGGLGIGLALVKSLIELHGGSVSVHSDGRGKGSEFAVRLPSETF